MMQTIYDLAAAQPLAPKRLLEADVQKQCVDWARARGYWARKFSSLSQRSVPDYLFAKEVSATEHEEMCFGTVHGRDGNYGFKIKFACEFKAPGKTSTEAQIEEQNAMRDAGWYVFECDDFGKFKTVVECYESACPI